MGHFYWLKALFIIPDLSKYSWFLLLEVAINENLWFAIPVLIVYI